MTVCNILILIMSSNTLSASQSVRGIGPVSTHRSAYVMQVEVVGPEGWLMSVRTAGHLCLAAAAVARAMGWTSAAGSVTHTE